MNQSQPPKSIQILLDCVQDPADLELEEMLPLKTWIEENPEGEQALSEALTQNARLETALNELPIKVPKMLERQIISYVELNSGDEEFIEPEDLSLDRPESNRWFMQSRPQFLAGLAVGLTAAVLLIGTSFQLFNGYFGYLNKEKVAIASIKWVNEIDDSNTWQKIGSTNVGLPSEISVPATRYAEIDTEFGQTIAYELWASERLRAVLFEFNTSKKYHFRFFGSDPDHQADGFQVGIAKDGNKAYVLNVEGTTSDYMNFIPKDYRTQLAVLLRTVWLLC